MSASHPEDTVPKSKTSGLPVDEQDKPKIPEELVDQLKGLYRRLTGFASALGRDARLGEPAGSPR